MAATALSSSSTCSATVLGVPFCQGSFPAKLGQEQPLHRRASISTAHPSLAWRLQMKWPFCFQCALREARGSVQAARMACALCPPRTRQWGSGPQRCVPAAYKHQPPREPLASALSIWCLLVSSLVVETPHQPLAPPISLKPRRESAPWGGGSRRGMSQLSAGRGLRARGLRSLWGDLFCKRL